MRTTLALLLLILATACGPKLIPGLDIEVPDTPDNRALLALMEKFQQAYENKDVEALAGLASSSFYETCGTNDTEDDYDLQGLRQHFSEYFKMIDKLSLSIALKDVKVEGDRATIDFRFLARYLTKLPSGEQWQLKDDIQRMKLVRENGQWKVQSGM
ncbi:MAG: hypothetical protein DRI34_05475 [Deltaproteobacteria bacterium]|nr:MAG: hypothetical protein DRI34_05475 [Deltaproteobacteria bacterium]